MSTDSTPIVGRVIRAALIILPFGTIVLGALSFVFYFNKQDKIMQRSIKYAAGLKKALNESDLKRYESIVSETLAKPMPERAKTLTTYIESTLGPENMGYELRTIADRADPQGAALAFDAEVTGTKRANDIVLVLTDYLSPDEGRSVACLLGLANALTGTPRIRTVRIAAVQNTAALRAYQQDAIGAYDRITHVILLGRSASALDSEIVAPLHLEGRGVVMVRPDITGQVLPAAQALLKLVSDTADRL